MILLRPDLAAWALVVPCLAACWTLHRYLRGRFRRRAAIEPRFESLSRRPRGGRDAAVLLLAALEAGGLVFAVVRPQARLRQQVPEYQQQDLVIMLDRSASMRARDIVPSRFARATSEIRNLIRHKPDGLDRIALVGFADGAVVLSNLTPDVDSVLFYFDWIDHDATPLFGTNIGEALTSAMDLVKKDGRPTPKVFILVSDGEDFGDALDRAVARARGAGDRINCIGIGSDRAVQIPITTADGTETVLRDEAGKPALTSFSEGTLRRIAATTGGRYVRSRTGTELRQAMADIVTGERRMVGTRTTTAYRDLYGLGLIVAAVSGAALWVIF